jgi:hypothetical protein
MTHSKSKMNSSVDNTSPYLRPFLTGNGLDNFFNYMDPTQV